MDEPPEDYTPPVVVYLVEEPNAAGEIGQIGAFFTEDEAREILRRPLVDGRDAYINIVPVHQRAVDWEYDR